MELSFIKAPPRSSCGFARRHVLVFFNVQKRPIARVLAALSGRSAPGPEGGDSRRIAVAFYRLAIGLRAAAFGEQLRLESGGSSPCVNHRVFDRCRYREVAGTAAGGDVNGDEGYVGD